LAARTNPIGDRQGAKKKDKREIKAEIRRLDSLNYKLSTYGDITHYVLGVKLSFRYDRYNG